MPIFYDAEGFPVGKANTPEEVEELEKKVKHQELKEYGKNGAKNGGKN